MTRSMTAFSRREIKGNWGTATWELRSVNQRYLEIHIRLPEQFRGLETIIRDRIRIYLARGKVECNLRLNVNFCAQNALLFNKKLAKQLIEAAQWVKMQSNEGEINPLAVLNWPGVIITTEEDLDVIRADLLCGLDAALNDFINARETEGNALKALIEQRLAKISIETDNIRRQMPAILNWQREKLLNKLKEVRVELALDRLEQELMILAQRIDVIEELDRLNVHIKETYNILNKKEAIGRRLDFMMQEFNREVNTLASKSINTNVTKSAIELKVLIEQMREQIQNIE